jgi:transketolase
MNSNKNQNLLLQDLSNCIRILTADAVEVAKSGHPGMPLGMADVMTVLACEFLKFNPNEPKWFNRDRLVLSAGHGSMLLYAFYYLAGFKDFSLDEIKNFRQLNSKAAGHPEAHMYDAIETTTGPLGQGIANAVGMAIAQKKHQAMLGQEACDYKIYSIVGDGCLMEGIAYEAASLAGHLKLNNLILIFDDNNISIDGNTNLAVSENHLMKFKALGFEVETIDGHNFDQIREALRRGANADKPYFIACKTIIGKGANLKAGTEKAHGSPLGANEIEYLKTNINAKKEPFAIDEKLLKAWREMANSRYGKDTNVIAREQSDRGNLAIREKSQLHEIATSSYGLFAGDGAGSLSPTKDEATRTSSGKILQELIKTNKNIICGSADLALSNNIFGENSKPITCDDFSGNFIHYGVREHAMGAIMNGLALSGFLPVGGTFFVFSDYMRPAIRLACIMKLKVIYVMTHDSIGVGEDGPTHQPIEHLASFRAMPNIKVFRPANFVETAECYQEALNYDGPSMLVLSRQNVKQLREEKGHEIAMSPSAPRNDATPCSLGAYVISQTNVNPDIVIFASGSELGLGNDVKEILEKSHNISIRLISLPCFENLEAQGPEYFKSLISGAKMKVAIEAGSSFGWHKIIGENGLFFGLDEFGLSAPAPILYEHFGLTAEKIAQEIGGKWGKE